MLIGMSANREISEIVTLAEALADAKGMKLSTISFHVAKSGSFLPKCRSGAIKNMTLVRRDEIMVRIAALWPDNAPWPTDIPRPTPTERAA